MKNKIKQSKVRLLFAVLIVLSLVSLTGQPVFGAEQAKAYSAGSVNFAAAESWEELPVSSPMRKYQFRIPKIAEDAEDGEMAVFYFGPGQGGSVESNIERWQSQFQPSPGSKEVASQISTKTVNGLKVTVLSMEGSFQAAMAMQGSSVKNDYALLGAIAEGPQGPVFFKLYGPRKTVQNARPAFDALVESFKA